LDAEPHDRRVSRGRRSLELILDGVMRPRDWAARLCYSLGLQGHVRATETTVRLGRPASAPPLRIGFASDFHAGPSTHRPLLQRACELLAEFNPDVVLLGGDFVSVRASYVGRLAPHLAKIRPPLGMYGVLGNHDLRANRTEVVAALEAAGVTMLTNQCARLPAPHDDVTICGLDDPTHGEPSAERAIDRAPGNRIIVMHSPDGLLAIGDRDFGLALCGHTHGGQIATPAGRAIVLPRGKLSRQYASGPFTLDGGRQLIVSRGVGCSTVPVRMFADPEVHLITVDGV
jgi:predicted MPP superfamily phosphohydrolase